MKILTLRIYNPTPDYDAMYELHRQYDKNSVYLVASELITEPIYNSETQILTVPGKETLIPGILEKTVKGIQYCLDHFSFDVLIRSNMSTVIDYTELEKQLAIIDQPYGGHIWVYGSGPNYFELVSGCCITMNRPICQYLVDHASELSYQLSDDLAIGKLLFRKFRFTFLTRYVQSNAITNSACFYRFRNDLSRYDQRESDIENMKHFYLLLNIS